MWAPSWEDLIKRDNNTNTNTHPLPSLRLFPSSLFPCHLLSKVPLFYGLLYFSETKGISRPPTVSDHGWRKKKHWIFLLQNKSLLFHSQRSAQSLIVSFSSLSNIHPAVMQSGAEMKGRFVSSSRCRTSLMSSYTLSVFALFSVHITRLCCVNQSGKSRSLWSSCSQMQSKTIWVPVLCSSTCPPHSPTCFFSVFWATSSFPWCFRAGSFFSGSHKPHFFWDFLRKTKQNAADLFFPGGKSHCLNPGKHSRNTRRHF